MFLDKNEEIEKKFGGNLPHMHQDGKMQYVTFRLADSLPASKQCELNKLVDSFKREHPEPWNHDIQIEYWKIIGPQAERLLHNGYGSCLLRFPEVRKVLIDTISHNDGIKYVVDAYVIMPNHIHMLICPIGKQKIEDILHSIKGFSGYAINKLTCSSGQFWMRESFDRLVRSEAAYGHYLRYIISNPRHLRSGEYTLYIRNSQ
ncbi:MAG: transposase [Muribaculaceae bacterium]|nr:transposase [Muribaculaceae bacterium]